MNPIGTYNLSGDIVKLYGWLMPELRTAEQDATQAAIVAEMPAFRISGSYRLDSRKVALYEARQKLSGGNPAYIWQSSGSCVGCGGTNAVYTLMDTEIAIKGEHEKPELLWWLFAYGESREIAGMNGKGEGSFGGAFAKAITTKGNLPASIEGLPKFANKDGWLWLNREVELDWSDGKKSPQVYDPQAAKHLVRTASPCRSAEDVAAAIQNGYPCSIASMFGTKGTTIQGEPAVAIAEWNDTWAHQTFLDAWWDHPQFGELFRIGNNWGPDAHGDAPDGSPRGGFWIRKATLQRICGDRGTEIFAFSGLDGFPARQLPDWWVF